MDATLLLKLVEQELAARLQARQAGMIPAAVSARHVHLAEADCALLFGGRPLTVLRELSQPGQFAAAETVTLVGPKGVLERVRVLGPARGATQVEISRSDALRLGVAAPVRESGCHDGTPGLTLVGLGGAVTLARGVILAQRHIHMTPEDAARFGVADREIVKVASGGDRALTLGAVLVRVSPRYRLELHLDTDEANAGLWQDGDPVELIRGSVAPAGSPSGTPVPDRADPRPPGHLVHDRKLLTEADVLAAARSGATALRLPPGALITALASDAARARSIELKRR